MKAADRLIVALDVAKTSQAEVIVSAIGSDISFFKIGYQLAFAGGLELARDLVADGNRVFLDMKLLDIDNTVARAVENIVQMGVTMTTLHAYPKTMKAAVDAARGSDLCLLAVSVLTSMDDGDLYDAGYHDNAGNLVAKRTQQAHDAGMGGIVASAREAVNIRKLVGQSMAVVTPGIRPQGSIGDDQKRIMTPADAIKAGASHLVVGRPIVAADNPQLAAQQILNEIEHI